MSIIVWNNLSSYSFSETSTSVLLNVLTVFFEINVRVGILIPIKSTLVPVFTLILRNCPTETEVKAVQASDTKRLLLLFSDFYLTWAVTFFVSVVILALLRGFWNFLLEFLGQEFLIEFLWPWYKIEVVELNIHQHNLAEKW